MQTARPIVNPDARSPYQRYGKHPYKYPGWAEKPKAERDRAYIVPIPREIAEELWIARRAAAQKVEQQIASFQRQQRAFRADDPFQPPSAFAGFDAPLVPPRPARWADAYRPVRAHGPRRAGHPGTNRGGKVRAPASLPTLAHS